LVTDRVNINNQLAGLQHEFGIVWN